jgi:G3E family GTPase
LRLKFALFGLRQALRAWSRHKGEALRAKGFVPLEADPSIWVLRNKVGAVLALFYVDDGIVAAKSDAEAEAIVNMVASIFKMQAWGAQRSRHPHPTEL